jgi:membrane associated rhomboid family serine protease
MLPRFGSSKLVTRWISITIAASLVAILDGGWLASWASLAPDRILHGQVWRLVTWPLIEPGPLGLILTCVAIYKFGSDLAVRWGDRRLRRFVAQIVIASAVVTCLLAAIAGGGYFERLGGWAVSDVLVIAWARQFPQQTLVVYGLLQLRGQQLVNLTIAVAVVYALRYGLIVMAPELLACAAAAAYPKAWLMR